MSFPAIRSKDWARPYGIARPELPPDDQLTDLAAWVNGQLDSLAADTFCLPDETGVR